MKQLLTPILSFFFLILLYGSVNGQTVTSATSCGELTTNYTDSSHSGNTNDPIFLFEGGTSSGELSFEEVVGATYDWYIFNPSTNSYDEHALNSTPTQTNLSDGGYLVVRTDGGGTITEGRAWVWSTSLVADAGADIDICNGSSTTINGSGTVLNPSFTYYDPVPRPFKIDNNTIITVTFDAVHSYVSDLAFYLMSPDEATIVTLGVNEPGNACNGGSNVSNLSFTNDPSIGTQIFDLCGMGAPLTGTYNHYYADYSPASGATAIDMSSLIGYDAGQGGWKVMIYDCEMLDTGSLTGASITFNDGLGNTRTYSSGAINVAINDNSCSSGSASIYEVPYITAAPASETLTIATGTGVNSTGGFEWSSSTVGPNGPWGASFNNSTASPVISPDQTTWYRLQIDNGLGCSSEDVIQVSVTDAPNSGVGTDTQACIGDTAIDLNGLLSGEDTGGVWSVSGTSVDAPGMDFDAAAGTYDPTTAGAYTFEYNVTAVSPCTIDAITSVTVTVSSLSDTGTDQQLSITNASGTIDLFSSLGGAPDVGGIWSMDATSTDAGSSFDAVMGTVDTSGLSFGTYVFNYTIASCITSVSTITLEYPNPCGAVDTDGDLINDLCDDDDDGDGYSDIMEMAEGTDPKDENSVPLDTDMDGDPNSTDPDDDGDGTTDANDAFPLDDSEDTDTDGDGTGDNADIDDDGDGYSDIMEMAEGTDPKDENSVPLDTDMDGDPNSTDPDDDGDGTTDANDAFPLDDSEDIDTDGDGTGNNADTDDDGDGFSDQAEIDRGTDPLDATSFPQEDDLEEEPIVPESKIVPAQAFTPNGDGNNDFWVVPGLANYPNNRVTIFNRSGHEVFRTQSYQNNWGGFYKNNNKKLPAGSYFYIIDLGDGSAPLQGWIFINY